MQLFHVIIPAAGIGTRMLNVLPKQYLPLAGKPIIAHIIQTFFSHPRITTIHLALSPEDKFWQSLSLNTESRLHIHYTGGESRSETVLNTLNAMQVDAEDWVLVHDAARPGLTHESLNRLLDTLETDAVGGLLALPVADTIKKSDEMNMVDQTISRQNLWQAQTPQMFRYTMLKQALSEYEGLPTDEAEAIEALGLNPKLVHGELRNLKVTYPEDLALLELIVEKSGEKT
ncbi:MAG: 2-C-methyl-D-erythritol 4-phosphate cytidylyltransferase [Methylophilaceae bacterium]|jgi:2-C-methyl-D-erythritol 4-phosphate cytidylyltransferase|nr:2-C-methyl-D-erythritol 4-phosphate cytidylyltransferase [Methylophilaceae bacterium]MDG1453386.1 2-C-methyl-D-erythritol 4-phosphate cytidylyltransferase [Methylophilaceae bacterium]